MAAKKKSPHTDAPGAEHPALDADNNLMSVPKEIVALPGLAPDETGYLVDKKYYAAVRFARGDGAALHTFGITCMAYAMDATGRPYLNAMGVAIEGAFSASCDKKELLGNSKKVSGVREAALDGAIREMLAHIAENVAFEKLKI